MSKKTRKAIQSISSTSSDGIDLSRACPSDLTLDQISLDPAFATLLDPGDADELFKLLEEIERDGFRDAVVVARLPDGTLILIDGYRRYRIWSKNYNSDPARAPKIIVIDVPDRQAAELWIIRNQMCRRNLTDAQKIELALKYEPQIAKKANDNRKGGVRLKSDEGQQSVDTNSVLSEIAGVSRDTFCKGKKAFKQGTPDLIQSLKLGKISVNAAACAADLPPDVQNEIAKTGRCLRTQTPKAETPRVEIVASKMESPAANVASKSNEPRKLPYIARDVGMYCRALLSEFKQGHLTDFHSPSEVNELRSLFAALIQTLDATDPKLTTSASDQALALIPPLELRPVDKSSTPCKPVQILPKHLDPRRHADNDFAPESPAAATNAMFDEQGQKFLTFFNGLEPLIQSIRESAPSNFTNIDAHFRDVCKGAESLGTDLVLMVNVWKLRQ